MNSKMTTNSQLLTTNPNPPAPPQLSKQLEQEQNHRNGDHMEGYQWGRGEWEEKAQGIRSIAGRHKIIRGRLRII